MPGLYGKPTEDVLGSRPARADQPGHGSGCTRLSLSCGVLILVIFSILVIFPIVFPAKLVFYSGITTTQNFKRAALTNQTREHLAQKLIMETGSGGLVSRNRKLVTVQLSMRALVENVPGDFVETGVYNGGTAILMAKVLQAYAAPERVLWAADSFKGLPKDDVEALNTGSNTSPNKLIGGKRASGKKGSEGQYASTRAVFEKNLRQNNLQNAHRVKILEGFFIDTLPTAPIETIAFLRLDGDIYVSTKQPLEILYERLSPGGFIYVDDYGSYEGCRLAVDEFRKQHGIFDPMIPVYENSGGVFEAVWWQKRTPIAR